MTGTGRKKILVVDDDNAFRIGTVAMLEDNGFEVRTAANGEEAVRKIADHQFDLVLTDLVMPAFNGIDLLKHIKERYPLTPVMMITGFGSITTAVEAMRLGAQDYITKPSDNDELLLKIQRVLKERERDVELGRLRTEVHGMYSFGSIIGQSSKMREVYRLVQQVAGSDVSVLIQGETGTGKELVAKAIHYNSGRGSKPFVVINCSALSETLLESELFGHEKGAFTGAHRQRIGKFEEANEGTVFLDEVGELPPPIQTKLLRVLQEREIQRVGGNTQIRVDIRLIAATNRNLAAMVEQGGFREDLFYRLNVFPIHLPPLRERLDDLPSIVDHLIKKHSPELNSRVKGLSPSLLPAMMTYEWKGNIRELENLIKRAIIKTEGETIVAIDIPSGNVEGSTGGSDEDVSFKDYMAMATQRAESTYIKKMLELYAGNVTLIAQVMGVDRKTIYRIIDKAGLDVSEYRSGRASGEDSFPQ
jgi:DNA-binding NtrC family response regulator